MRFPMWQVWAHLQTKGTPSTPSQSRMWSRAFDNSFFPFKFICLQINFFTLNFSIQLYPGFKTLEIKGHFFFSVSNIFTIIPRLENPNKSDVCFAILSGGCSMLLGWTRKPLLFCLVGHMILTSKQFFVYMALPWQHATDEKCVVLYKVK